MKFIILVGITAACLSITACAQNQNQSSTVSMKKMESSLADQPYAVTHTEEEWKKILTPEQYQVLREKETERACSGAFWKNHEAGMYVCAGCNNPLFQSGNKFESGTGWPSFFEPVSDSSLRSIPDTSFGMIRTEVVCNHCGGHLGHVFDDAPNTPTGLRYCINSISMNFVKE